MEEDILASAQQSADMDQMSKLQKVHSVLIIIFIRIYPEYAINSVETKLNNLESHVSKLLSAIGDLVS